MPRVKRDLNDWEMGEMFRMLNMLANINPDLSIRDGWEWRLNEKGLFTAKSLYVELVNARELELG